MNANIEKTVNAELQRLNPHYRIRNLRVGPEGDYWFDLEMKFSPKDTAAVNRIFKKYLGRKHAASAEEVVQAKYYIRSSTTRKLRELAARTGRTQSEIVEEQLSKL